MSINLHSVASKQVFNKHFKEQGAKDRLSLLYFWTTWHQPCEQLGRVVDQLAKDHKNITFFKIEAEKLSDLSESFGITSIPTIVLFQGVLETERLLGKPVAEVVSAVQAFAKNAPVEIPLEKDFSRISRLVNSAPVMLFMKGSPTNPRCGFSRQMVDSLKSQNVVYGYFDILTDPEVRAGLKKFSNWPTYPQLYAKGKLLGGLDVVKQLVEDDEFLECIPQIAFNPEAAKKSIQIRLKELTNKSPLMVFLKGTPDNPVCGFSAKIVELLKRLGVKRMGHFNILEDNEVRQNLKEFSNWPTYPQVYIDGKLVGGLDVCKEMSEDGDLKDMLPGWVYEEGEAPSADAAATTAWKGGPIQQEGEQKQQPAKKSDAEINRRLKGLIDQAPIMLFMKGSPDNPNCGFSRRIVEMLRGAGVTKMGHFDILQDNEVRQGLKEYSSWPTYPQLYINGSLVGGLDVCKEMIEEGDLQEMLEGCVGYELPAGN